MPTFIQNQDGSYSQQVLTPFDPKAIQQQIDDLNSQAKASADLASRNALAEFQPKIDALQSMLDAFNAFINAV